MPRNVSLRLVTMMTEKKVTIQILGDASKFEKAMKSSQQAATGLDKLTKRFRTSSLRQDKQLQKITQNFNKKRERAGNAAFEHEKRLAAQIKKTIQLLREKSKAQQMSARAMRAEVAQLDKLERQHRRIQTFRKSTGHKGGFGERMNAAGNSRAAGMAGNAMNRLGQMMGGLIVGAISRLVGAIAGQIKQGYSSYVAFGRAQAGLGGIGRVPGGALTAGRQFGYSMTDTVQQMRGVARQTGQMSAVTGAQRMARSFGGDVGQMSGFMGTLTRAGQGFGGRAGRGGEKQAQRILQHAFTAGLDKSRAGEHLTAVASAVRSAQSVTAGKVDASQVSAMLALFGRSGQPGLQGAAGMAQLSKVDSAIKGAGFGGGGDAATSLLYQSQGFGTPGGGTSYYNAKKQLQRGVFGEGGAGNLFKFMNRANQIGGVGSERSNLTISKMSGLSLDVVEAMQETLAKGGGEKGILKRIAKITEEERPIQEQIRDSIKTGNLVVAQRVAKLQDRLVDIGKQNAEAIEALEDLFNSIVDKLMPDAVKFLKWIAETVTGIWNWIKGFLHEWRGTTAAGKELNKLEIQRQTVLGVMKADPSRRKWGAEQLRGIANKQRAAGAGLVLNPDSDVSRLETLEHYARLAGRYGFVAPGISLGGTSQREDRDAMQRRANRASRQTDIDSINADWGDNPEALAIAMQRRAALESQAYLVSRTRSVSEADRPAHFAAIQNLMQQGRNFTAILGALREQQGNTNAQRNAPTTNADGNGGS